MHLSENKNKDNIEIMKNLPYPIYVIDAEDYTIQESNREISLIEDGNVFCYKLSRNYDQPCDKHGEACPLKMVKKVRNLSLLSRR